jgi:hypothetical protein
MRRTAVGALALLILSGCGSEAPEPRAQPTPEASVGFVDPETAERVPSADGSPTIDETGPPAAVPSDPPSSSSPEHTAAPVESAASSPDPFVSVVRAELPDVAGDRSDGEIANLAAATCADLAAGTDAETILATTRSLGTIDAEATDAATARELVKLAIDTVCPDQAGRVDEFGR